MPIVPSLKTSTLIRVRFTTDVIIMHDDGCKFTPIVNRWALANGEFEYAVCCPCRGVHIDQITDHYGLAQ